MIGQMEGVRINVHAMEQWVIFNGHQIQMDIKYIDKRANKRFDFSRTDGCA